MSLNPKEVEVLEVALLSPIAPLKEAVQVSPESPDEARPPRKKASPAQRKLNAYVAPEVQEAIKRAHYWTSTRPRPGGYRTFSALVEDVLRAKAKELEDAFNDGQPFDPIPDGDTLQQGRPLGQ